LRPTLHCATTHARLKIAGAATLDLAAGQLQVVATAKSGAGRLTIEAGETTVDAGAGSFNLFYRPDPAVALAQRAYARASLASAASPVQSDAGSGLPVWEKAAQITAPVPGDRSPGLYVQVLDGIINLSNKGDRNPSRPGSLVSHPPSASRRWWCPGTPEFSSPRRRRF
jgi:hypothetical protein